MADEAGSSGTGTSGLSPEALQEAERKFERGIQCIRVGDRLRKGGLTPAASCEQAVPLQFAALFSPTRRRWALCTRCRPTTWSRLCSCLPRCCRSGRSIMEVRTSYVCACACSPNAVDVHRTTAVQTYVCSPRAELAPECASAYYRYGAALLYQAQDSADVFGAGVRESSDDGIGASEAGVWHQQCSVASFPIHT